MTHESASEKEEAPQGPPSPPDKFAVAIAVALFTIPIGGLILMFSANAFLHGWLGVVPKMSYGEACGGMTLVWLIRFFLYPRRP